MYELSSERDKELFAQRWRVRWHDYLPAAGLVMVMVLAWLAHTRPGEMSSWGVFAAALMRGRYETIALHMFAHGGVFHLLTNSLGLLEIGGLVTARLGSFPKGWARSMAVYGLAGLSSMIFYLSFHPQGAVPMIGASGAIYGLVGLLLGIRLIEELEPVELIRLPIGLVLFVKNNLFFLILLLIGGALAGFGGGVAWEAHLGASYSVCALVHGCFRCCVMTSDDLTPPPGLASRRVQPVPLVSAMVRERSPATSYSSQEPAPL